MTAYVDDIRDYGEIARSRNLPGTLWAHLTADTREELHTFASRIGLRRSWFQDRPIGWHYDVTPGIRARALRAGAREVTVRELAGILESRRAPAELPPGIRPGTAACLSCDWKWTGGGDVDQQTDEHGRETGHVTMSRPVSTRRYGRADQGESGPQTAAQPLARPARKGRAVDVDQGPTLWEVSE